MSRTTAHKVVAEMLTVPGQAACSCEQEIVTGGRRCTTWAAAISRAMAHATTVSVIRGRYGPCCSKLPMGRTATPARPAPASAVVVSGDNRSDIRVRPCRSLMFPTHSFFAPRDLTTGRPE